MLKIQSPGPDPNLDEELDEEAKVIRSKVHPRLAIKKVPKLRVKINNRVASLLLLKVVGTTAVSFKVSPTRHRL